METVAAVTTVAGTIVGVASLWNGVWQYRRKVHLESFRTYADRYNAILTCDLLPKWRRALNGEKETWPDLTPTMICYLNLVWEECYLSADKVIPQRLWLLWQPEIQAVLSSEFAKSVINEFGFHFPADLQKHS